MPDIYAELAGALDRHSKEIRKSDPPTEKGKLGYSLNGSYSVVSDDPMKYYVRFPDGFFVKAYHDGKCPPSPDLPVLVLDARGKRPQIYSVDRDLLASWGGSASGAQQVGPHTHQRYSGLEFDIDLRLIKQLSLRVEDDLTVSVGAGFYWWEGSLLWFEGEEIDLTDDIAGLTADKQAWCIVAIDPTLNELVTVVGTEFDQTLLLSPTDILDIDLTGYIPSTAVKIYDGQTAFKESDFESMLPIGTGLGGNVAGGGAAADATYWLAVADGDLPNAYDLDSLSDGLVKHASGVPAAAVAETDYVTPSGAGTLANKTLTAPVIADFTNANHDHTDADDGGLLTPAALPPSVNMRHKSFNQASGTITLYDDAPGTLFITQVSVAVTSAAAGGSPTIQAGTAALPHLLFAPADVDLTATGNYSQIFQRTVLITSDITITVVADSQTFSGTVYMFYSLEPIAA